MRSNQPVTQREYAFPPGATLVSVTDLKGRITYCNPAFVEVSGFARDELMGQPHNLVRHPDMPEEAFRDMWATIEAGLPWSGYVKNRRKNGDHYWVQAHATPMKDGERITGYLSVRTQPAPDGVQGAEALYARMRDEAASGNRVHRLQQGKVMRTDLTGRMGRWLKPGQRGLLTLLTLAAGAVPAAAVALLGPWGFAAVPVAAAIAAFGVWRLAFSAVHAVLADANQLAAGNLAHRITTGAPGLAGELQQALMQLSVNLRTVISDTRVEIESMRNAAREIAAGNQDLSERTESQASSLEETAASMEQINTTVRHSTDAARQGALASAAAADSSINAFYAGQTKTGLTGGLRGDIEYMLTPQLRIGGALRFDQAADWSETRGLVYARYRFDR